jgi:cell division septation protein DedD
MKMLKVACMLLACTDGTKIGRSDDIENRDTKLSQSLATAFQMEPPKLMNQGDLPEASLNGKCPSPGQMLTKEASGGAFLDGCYMNTTRLQPKNEPTGEEAQNYLYMWKHACAYLKWVPSNQFMYSGIDYNEESMTLERFGFIGMDKRCFWGSIGIIWKRPLPVE